MANERTFYVSVTAYSKVRFVSQIIFTNVIWEKSEANNAVKVLLDNVMACDTQP